MSVVIDLGGIEKRFSEEAQKKRQTEFAMKAGSMMRKYVPEEETILRNSEPMNSDYANGKLIWNTPYAAKHYYVEMHHTTAGTTDHWDQAMKENDMDALADYAEKLFGGKS